VRYLDPETIRTGMNELAGKRTPFLMAVDFELTRGFLIPDPASGQEVYFSLRGTPVTPPPRMAEALGSSGGDGADGRKRDGGAAFGGPRAPLIVARPESLESYRKKFAVVQSGLSRGDSYLVNLTLRTPVDCRMTLEEIYLRSGAPYTLCVPGSFVCFSPERFVSVDPHGEISTRPMKGTINASLPGAAETILADLKESAEHATVVDLLRNDLSLSAKKVRVAEYRYIDLVRTSCRDILQVSSDIRGQLGPDYRRALGDLIFRMLPAGSVSGAPKGSTLDIIRRSEDGPRGFYAGIVGYFDGRSFDSGVLIRLLEIEDGRFYFRSGGGITALSKLEDEYLEAVEKIYLPFENRPKDRLDDAGEKNPGAASLRGNNQAAPEPGAAPRPASLA
jgi:para-aminobenzoate synthetase component 1